MTMQKKSLFRRFFGLGADASKFWISIFGRTTWAGETITPETAMSISSVYRAVNLYASTIASLPLNLYREGARSPVIERGSEWDQVLRVSPNEYQTPMEFWESMVAARMLLGNAYAELKFSGRRLVALQPLDPYRTGPVVNRVSRNLEYKTRDADGLERVLSPDRVLHIRGVTFGGPVGISPISAGANSMATTMAADKVAGKMFRSGLSSSGFIETNAVLNEDDRDDLQKILEQYAGSDNAGKIMLLEGGMTYKALSISPQDAQLLTSRAWNVEEIARWFGVPPILIGHASQGQTMWGTGTEALLRAWYTLGLRQELKRFEDAIRKRVIGIEDRRTLFPKFNADAILRGDSAAQAALFSTYAQNGIMTREEIRDLLELPFIPGSDELTAQVNLAPLDSLGQESAQTEAQIRSIAETLRPLIYREAQTNAPPAVLSAPPSA